MLLSTAKQNEAYFWWGVVNFKVVLKLELSSQCINVIMWLRHHLKLSKTGYIWWDYT